MTVNQLTPDMRRNAAAGIAKRTAFLALIASMTIFVIQLKEYSRNVIVDKHDGVNIRSEDKIILTWTPFFGDYTFGFGDGKKAFKEHQCTYTNCYFTNNRLLLPQHKFNAIIFHNYEFYELFFGKPRHRSTEQLYVFMSLESASRSPMTKKDFYNLTMTYRLDSDIPWKYYEVRDTNNTVVAPKMGANWLKPDGALDVEESFARNKSKMAAWFVSNCHSTNEREKFGKSLQGYTQLDIYGKCGNLTCRGPHCLKMLSRDYYFYMAFENSHCEDYLTEKILTAYLSDTIPVIYAKVNLTNFLPPHSYIDASLMTPKQLSTEMNKIRRNMTSYLEYFWWKKYYTFHNTMPNSGYMSGGHPFCELCRVLNEGFDRKSRDLVQWWQGEGICVTS